MKAGKSSEFTGVLPSAKVNASIASKVSFAVAMPGISSTNCIAGTGFMKCIPMNRAGRSVAAPSRVIEIDEVLDAMIASSLISVTMRL